MEDLGFDISGILSDEEAEQLFEKTSEETAAPENKGASQEQNAEEKIEETSSEGVGVEEEKDAAQEQGGGTSPNVYSSIASALKKDGILSDFEDSEIEAVTTPEAFAELFEKVKRSGLDEAQKRIYDALNNGMKPDEIRQYEQTIGWLNGIGDDKLNEEGEEGEDLRKRLIYNDLINRGYSQEKAIKEIEKSFKSGSDIEDAKDALDALKRFYGDAYKQKQDNARKEAEAVKEKQKKQADDFKKMVLDDDIKFGDSVLSKSVCNKIYDAVSKPIYKDADTGRLLTAVQKFQKEKPLEFLKQLGMWYVLTDGGKDISGIAKTQVIAEKNKNIKELERKINSSMFNDDGSLSYVGSSARSGYDPLLSDDWKIG